MKGYPKNWVPKDQWVQRKKAEIKAELLLGSPGFCSRCIPMCQKIDKIINLYGLKSQVYDAPVIVQCERCVYLKKWSKDGEEFRPRGFFEPEIDST